MDPKRLEAYQDVEFFRRRYLEQKLLIPGETFGDPHRANAVWKQARSRENIYAKAAKARKLPELLPESVYDDLERRIRTYVETWSHLRRTNNRELGEQARKRIRKVFEALFCPLDRREKLNILTLWDDCDEERRMIQTIIKLLRELQTPLGTIPGRDEKHIACAWGLTRDEVKEIWREQKKWKALVRDRLARRYSVSKERLDRVIPISRRASVARMKNLRAVYPTIKSLAEPLLPDEILKAVSKADFAR
jgi:hypothetical protein